MARSFYADNRRVSNARIKNELGVVLRFPDYRAGARRAACRGSRRALAHGGEAGEGFKSQKAKELRYPVISAPPMAIRMTPAPICSGLLTLRMRRMWRRKRR